MKKILLFSVISYLSIFTVFAQSFQLSDGSGTISNGDTITHSSSQTNVTIEAHASIKNISTNVVRTLVKRTEIVIIPTTKNSFCWLLCYPPFINESPDTIDIASGHTDNHFVGDYRPMGTTGTSIILYTFFNAENTNDSISFVVKYISGVVGIDDANPNITVSNLYPNPAVNNVSIQYNLDGTHNAELEIRNVLGSIVKTIKIEEMQGILSIDVSDLTNGVYFYSFIANNTIIKSKKLVIQR